MTLASLGVPPYSPPAEDWEGEYPDFSTSTDGFGPPDMSRFAAMPPAAPGMETPGGISFADMVRTISPSAERDAWREDNRAPFWIPDDAQALAGPSLNDFVRFVDQAGLSDPMRTPAPAAFRTPGLPDDAARWSLRESAPTGIDRNPPIQLADWRGWAALWLIWNRLRGGRLPSDSRTSAPSGRKGEPLRTLEGPPRNSPGEVNNRPYSGHAFDKMQDQGLPPSAIENAARRGAPRPGEKPGTTRYYDEKNNLSVVVDNKTGRVITNHYGDR